MMGPLRDFGPCEAWYNSAKVGETQGRVGVRFSDRDAKVFEASNGVTPVDAVHIGQDQVEVTVPFTRLSLAKLATILPGSSSGTSGIDISNNKVGTSKYDLSSELILKPIIGTTVGASNTWLHIFKTYPRPDYDIPYSVEEGDQRLYNTVFESFPDATTKKVWRVGAA